MWPPVFARSITARRADAFVRVCGDSPLIDPALVDEAIALYHRHDCDLVTNVFPRSFPKGQSVEVIRSAAFLRAMGSTCPCQQREHITQVYYQNPAQFHIVNFSSDLEAAAIQLSVDTWDDYDHMQHLIQACAGKTGGMASVSGPEEAAAMARSHLLNAAIIGLGVGERHVELAMRPIPAVDVTTLCDIDPQKLQAVGRSPSRANPHP
jgi:hypothetical protein